MRFFARIAAPIIAAASLFATRASADDAPVSRGQLADDIDGYYAGEALRLRIHGSQRRFGRRRRGARHAQHGFRTRARLATARARRARSITFAGAGVATYGFAGNRDAFKGAGIGLFAIGFPFLVIDAVNQGRASRYLDHVERFDVTPSHDENFVSHGLDERPFGASSPFMASYGGVF